MGDSLRVTRTCSRCPRREGISLLEVTVAVAMLSLLLASSVTLLRLSVRQQQTAERRAIARQAVQAAAELAGNMLWDQLTPAALEQMGIPADLASHLPGGELAFAVAEEANPAAKRITITLTWGGEPARTVALTTWAFPELP